MTQSFNEFLKKANLEKKSYQEEGVTWCLKKETKPKEGTMRGGFIADEMGLGKTITMLAVIDINPVPQTLIVLPVALIDQWVDQIKKTTDQTVLVYHGPVTKIMTRDILRLYKIIITSYHYISIKKGDENKQSILHENEWDRIIYDEAHHLRNKETSQYRGANHINYKAKQMGYQTAIQWFISGTLIQNTIKDFYHLCALLQLPASYYAKEENLTNLLEEYVLRRKKSDIGLNLEPCTMETKNISWSNPTEKKIAENLHKSLSYTLTMKDPIETKDTKDPIETKDPKDPIEIQEDKMLVRYIRAKQMCIMPSLAWKAYQPHEPIKTTTKIDELVKTLVERKDNGAGKIVFCHYQAEMDEIENHIKQNGFTRTAKLDGRCSQKQKKAIITNKDGYEVLLLQIQTCCEGLNLQEKYSEVYFVSPHWNPSVEDQAIARCHRFGQKKPVHVFRFIMDETKQVDSNAYITLDQHIFSVQEKKREIASTVM